MDLDKTVYIYEIGRREIKSLKLLTLLESQSNWRNLPRSQTVVQIPASFSQAYNYAHPAQ